MLLYLESQWFKAGGGGSWGDGKEDFCGMLFFFFLVGNGIFYKARIQHFNYSLEMIENISIKQLKIYNYLIWVNMKVMLFCLL